MGKDGISFQPKMSTNKQIKVRTQVLCKDLRHPAGHPKGFALATPLHLNGIFPS